MDLVDDHAPTSQGGRAEHVRDTRMINGAGVGNGDTFSDDQAQAGFGAAAIIISDITAGHAVL